MRPPSLTSAHTHCLQSLCHVAVCHFTCRVSTTSLMTAGQRPSSQTQCCSKGLAAARSTLCTCSSRTNARTTCLSVGGQKTSAAWRCCALSSTHRKLCPRDHRTVQHTCDSRRVLCRGAGYACVCCTRPHLYATRCTLHQLMRYMSAPADKLMGLAWPCSSLKLPSGRRGRGTGGKGSAGGGGKGQKKVEGEAILIAEVVQVDRIHTTRSSATGALQPWQAKRKRQTGVLQRPCDCRTVQDPKTSAATQPHLHPIQIQVHPAALPFHLPVHPR